MGKSKRKSKLTVQRKSPLVSSSGAKATEAKVDSNNSKKNSINASNNSTQQCRYHNDRQQKKQKQQNAHSGTSTNSNGDNNNDDDIFLPKSFPQHLPRPTDDFLRDEDPFRQSFQAAMEGPYEGFVVDTANDLAKMGGGNAKQSPDDSYTIHEETIQSSLLGMYQQDYFRTDVTQPFGLGTKCAKTYVTRCLVGERGTTYKYLGLRMFAHPYSELHNNHNNPHTRTIQSLGLALTQRTKIHLHALDVKRKQQRHITGTTTPTTISSTIRGRPDFDICLINRMVYSDDLKPVLEPNTLGGCGGGVGNSTSHHQEHSSITNNNNNVAKTTVSWHADSSLEHYSTIAVYQTLQKSPNHDGKGGGQDQETPHMKIKQQQPPSKMQPSNMQHKKTIQKRTSNGTTNDQHQWWVALRVAHCVEGPQSIQKKRQRGTTIDSVVVKETPPIAVSLPSGSAYYLLDDFNHHHQHTVMTTGDSHTAGVRYSCTFRLLRDSHNVQDWLIRGKSAISQFHKKGNKLWRSEQLLLTTIETEWIRQFYIQGMKHYELLWYTYWKEPIQELLQIWSQLERRTSQVVDLLRAAAEGKCGIGMMTTTTTTSSTNDPTRADRPTKAERKARDRRKKALATVQDLLTRGGNNTSTSTATSGGRVSPIMELYWSMAELLEERAEMRELWEKREKDHVFHELPPDCRPMPVPFRFQCSMDEPMDGSYGISPLPGVPSKLKELALQLRQLGEAYQNGDRNKLPPSLYDKPTRLSDGIDSDHSKTLDWHGWNISGSIFGLELQHPWASWVVDGKKAIETRLYRLPDALIGKKVMIIESTNGKAGVSALDNVIDFSTAKVIGWVVFTKVIVYKSRESFEADETLHLVTPDSGYGWKDGTTLEVFGWVVGQYGRNLSSESDNNGKYVSAIRRMRSLFELKVKVADLKIKDNNRPGTTTTTTTNSPGTTTTLSTTNPRKQNKRNRNHNNNNKNKGERADQNGNHGGKRKKRF